MMHSVAWQDQPGKWGLNLRSSPRRRNRFRGLSAMRNSVSIPLMKRICLAILLMVSLLSIVSAEPAKLPLLHPLFGDHAVLQRDMRVPVWGWTEPGASVTVAFAGQNQTAKADAKGKWMVRLKPMRASSEPRNLTVSSSAAEGSVTIKDVLVGDVWLGSGQSNMEMGIELCDAAADIANANFPNLRLLTIPKRTEAAPIEIPQCAWLPCSPETIKQGSWGGFSATAFYFGRELHRELNIPIGLIHSSWGGTVAEAWTSAEALEKLEDFSSSLDWIRQMRSENGQVNYSTAYDSWFLKKDSGTQHNWQKAKTDSDWKTVSAPLTFEQWGLERFDGVAWFRNEFTLPEDWAGKDLQLQLGWVDDYDTAWVNGVKVGETFRVDEGRNYRIPSSALKPGKNTIAIRVLDTGGNGGFGGNAGQLRIVPTGDSEATPLSLADNWQLRTSATFAELALPAVSPRSNNPNVPTYLYNGMIAPLLPFAIKGAIWYQGESNADRAGQYRRLLPTMIADWRSRFGVGDFPFYLVQLASFQPGAAEPRDHSWAFLREAQAQTVRDVPNTGMAVAIDIGDVHDIHPKDKRNVGHRLALCALAETYGKDIEYSGPWYRSMKVTKDGIRLKFDHTDGGLVARGGTLKGFSIAGGDRKFFWADAVIDGNTVVVSSSKVPEPVAVRYAWDTSPECSLYNAAGLPAVPFRTDNWEPANGSK